MKRPNALSCNKMQDDPAMKGRNRAAVEPEFVKKIENANLLPLSGLQSRISLSAEQR